MHEDIARMIRTFAPDSLVLARGDFVPHVVSVLREMRLRIPEDIDVATFDEVPETCPEKKHIHEVVQPLYRLGKTAVDEMENLIRNKRKNVKEKIVPEIRIKQGGGDGSAAECIHVN
jgi:DNA-binding LacI/PurR family transcriptional regulator